MPTSNSLPPRVLIFERNSDGHRLFYVRLLVEGATQRGIEPIVLTAQAAIESREWAIHLAHLESKFRLIVSNANGPRVIARVASELAVSEVLVPDADRFLLAVAKTGGWRGSSKLRGLVMRTKAQPRRVPGLQLSITAVKRLALQSLKAGRRVRILELVSALTQTPRSDQVIDPTEFRGDLPGALATREQFDLKPADFVFAILGAIDPRKNIARVLSAIRQLPPNRAVLLIAGRWSDELFEETRSARQLAERDGVRVIVENRTLSDKELDDRILMADALVVAHSNEGPSGLVAKAVAAGTSVLAAGAQSLRQDASSRPELIRWVPLDEIAIAEGLRAALEQGRGPKSSPSAVALNTGFVDPFLRGISGNA